MEDTMVEDPKSAANPAANQGSGAPAAGADKGAANANPPADNKGSQGSGQPANDDQKMVPLGALHESREEVKTLKGELNQLRQMVSTLSGYGAGAGYGQPNAQPNVGYQPTGYQQPNPTVQQNAKVMEELWETDPKRAMQAEMQMMLSWYDKVNADVEVQEEEVAGKYKDFNTYRPHVRKYLRMVRPEARNNPGVVETAYFLVKGQMADQIANQSQEELARRMAAGENAAGISAGASSGSPAPKSDAPTGDQLKAAAAMGMTIDEYMQHAKR
jgi:hypothetical protein